MNSTIINLFLSSYACMSFECIWMFGSLTEKPSEENHDSPMQCYFVLQEKAQCFQKALASQADKSTQTELVGHDVSSCIKQYFLSRLWVFRLLSAGLPLLLCPCMDLVILKYPQKHEKIIITACQHTNALLILGFMKS